MVADQNSETVQSGMGRGGGAEWQDRGVKGKARAGSSYEDSDSSPGGPKPN